MWREEEPVTRTRRKSNWKINDGDACMKKDTGGFFSRGMTGSDESWRVGYGGVRPES